MDGEKSWKTLLKWMIWGETPTIFGNTHVQFRGVGVPIVMTCSIPDARSEARRAAHYDEFRQLQVFHEDVENSPIPSMGCLMYLPTFTLKNNPNVGKYDNTRIVWVTKTHVFFWVSHTT